MNQIVSQTESLNDAQRHVTNVNKYASAVTSYTFSDTFMYKPTDHGFWVPIKRHMDVVCRGDDHKHSVEHLVRQRHGGEPSCLPRCRSWNGVHDSVRDRVLSILDANVPKHKFARAAH
jgi:hypothetical protein